MGNALGRFRRQPTPINTENISLTYSVGQDSNSVTEHFDYLIVACDPRALPLSTRTALEKQVSDSLTSFTFNTNLFKARRPRDPELSNTGDGVRSDTPNYAVRFNPEPLAKQNGEVYGFRDEVMARDPKLTPSANKETWLTTYQLDGKGLIGRNEEQIRNEFKTKRDLNFDNTEQKWLNFELENKNKEPEDSALVDYFPHFESDDLNELLPWKIRDAQGDKNTLYVSSFTCFESVLHCYLYAAELMDPDGKVVKESFPTNKNARIAVVGAGPSGIMFACLHLARNGYNNFKVFEKSERFGGKTITVRKPAPADPNNIIPCELGTCYLSLGYEPMYWMFDEYNAGNVESLDKGNAAFRSIIDGPLAKDEEERENGIDFDKWTMRKNGPNELVERIEFFVAAIKFIVIHYSTMGMTMEDSMPAEPPSESTVLGNLHRVFVDSAKNLLFGVGDGNAGDLDENEQGEEELQRRDGNVPVNNIFNVLNEKPGQDKKDKRGLFGKLRDMHDDFKDITNEISESDLKEACKDVFRLPFATFLDKNGMSELKSTFIYAYQVQGYGTIETIPTYYGFIWITPAVLLGAVRKLVSTDPEIRDLGTVNILSNGWLTLWEKMVAKHLTNKITYNTNITNIDRK